MHVHSMYIVRSGKYTVLYTVGMYRLAIDLLASRDWHRQGFAGTTGTLPGSWRAILPIESTDTSRLLNGSSVMAAY